MCSLRPLLLASLIVGLLGLPVRASRTVIVLDPGHGGHDRGAKWGGVSEKTITLNIARRVEKYLKARGFLTAMTRRGDVFRSLESRAAVANAFERSVFISIHCNYDPRHNASGIETFYCGGPGRSLASSIQGRLDSRTSTPDRGIKFRKFCVLRRTGCPAALVECGFLTSPKERRLLTTGIYQDRIALAISDGIARSLNR